MPRLPPGLIRKAYSESPLLKNLLVATRDLQSARNELRWLKNHAVTQSKQILGTKSSGEGHWQHALESFCEQRRRGKPLQYILGSEYFGDLELRCEPNVLIPRWETASITSHLATLISRSTALRSRPSLRILDLCTGTGCIPLLLQHSLQQSAFTSSSRAKTLGIDISPHAIRLARSNLAVNTHILASSPGSSAGFSQADILSSIPGPVPLLSDILSSTTEGGSFDILTSNPPYISPRGFQRTTTRSVRRYEPRLALVPPPLTPRCLINDAIAASGTRSEAKSEKDVESDQERGDAFYPALLNAAVNTGVGGVMFEVGDEAQARRVAEMARQRLASVWSDVRVELWRDEPSAGVDGWSTSGDDLLIRGEGNVRAVFAYDAGRGWFNDDGGIHS